MKINIDGIKFLGEVLGGELNYAKLKRLTKIKGVSKFIEHEKIFNKGIDKFTLMEEIIKLKIYEDYKDIFNLYILKENLLKLYIELEFIKAHEEKIIDIALDKVYKIVPKSIDIYPNIYLYGGGIDGGFTLYGKEAFINYIKYLANMEEFIKVLSHELFHCRNISITTKLKNYLKLNIKERYLYEVLGKILEEGIALFIQHGRILEKDDPVGSLTKEKLSLVEREFKKLNDVLVEIKEGRVEYINIKTLDYYSLGYYVVSFLCDFYDKEILFPWILEYNYKSLIKYYIEGVRKNDNYHGFSKDIENWILNL